MKSFLGRTKLSTGPHAAHWPRVGHSRFKGNTFTCFACGPVKRFILFFQMEVFVFLALNFCS